jgi:hypothetical protein
MDTSPLNIYLWTMTQCRSHQRAPGFLHSAIRAANCLSCNHGWECCRFVLAGAAVGIALGLRHAIVEIVPEDVPKMYNNLVKVKPRVFVIGTTTSRRKAVKIAHIRIPAIA